MMDCKITLCLS